jgi:hypothetical protein
MASNDEIRKAMDAEFERLGLDAHDIPGGGLAGSADGIELLLRHLRALSPGATWREVFPDLPAHWLPGRPETWTRPYRPLGTYDYQELPTGPVAHVLWDGPGSPSQLDELIAAACTAGWPIHGAGLVAISNPEWTTVHAMIVLERGSTVDQLHEFATWLDACPGIRYAGSHRLGTEKYLS